MIERMGPQRGPFKKGYRPHTPRPVEAEARGVIRKLITSGPEERAMYRAIAEALAAKPEAGPMTMMSLFSYAQVRCLYDSGRVWEPHVTARPPLTVPAAAAAHEGLVTLGA